MSGVRTPILFLLILVLFLGAYYFLYARKKTNYLGEGNLRLLATTGNMVAEAITSYGDWVKSQDEIVKALQDRGLGRRNRICHLSGIYGQRRRPLQKAG